MYEGRAPEAFRHPALTLDSSEVPLCSRSVPASGSTVCRRSIMTVWSTVTECVSDGGGLQEYIAAFRPLLLAECAALLLQRTDFDKPPHAQQGIAAAATEVHFELLLLCRLSIFTWVGSMCKCLTMHVNCLRLDYATTHCPTNQLSRLWT